MESVIVQVAVNRLTEFFHVLGSPILQCEWDIIRKALVEGRNTSTNSAMPKCDPCCSMFDTCPYRVDKSHGVIHYPPCGRTSA